MRDLDAARDLYQRDPAYRRRVRERVTTMLPIVAALARLDALENRIAKDAASRQRMLDEITILRRNVIPLRSKP